MARAHGGEWLPVALRLSQKLTAAITVAGLILVVGALSVGTLEVLIRATTRVDRTDATIQQLQSVRTALQDGETGQRGYPLTSDSAYLGPYHTAERRADSALAMLRGMPAVTPRWPRLLDSLSSDVHAKIRVLDETIALHDTAGAAAAIRLVRSNRGRRLMDQARDQVNAMELVARNQRRAEAAMRARAASLALLVIVLASIVAFLLSLLVNRAVRRDVQLHIESEERLRESADALAAQTTALEEQIEESHALTEELTRTSDQLQEALVDAEAGRTAAQTAERNTLTILSSVPDAITVFDRDGRWRYVNSQAAALLTAMGKDADRLIGRSIWEEMPQLEQSRFGQETRRALATNEVVEFEEWVPKLDAWLEQRVIPTGKTLVTISRDVTERMRAQESAQFEADLNAALAAVPLDYADLPGAIARVAVPRLADSCTVEIHDADGLQRQTTVHRDPESQQIVSGSAPDDASNPDATLAVPIPGAVAPLGTITLVMFDLRRRMTPRVRALAATLANRAGVVVERATSLRQTQLARDAAKSSATRFEFLSKASQVLGASLDYESTLQHLAQLCIGELADWCSIDVVDRDGVPRQLSAASGDADTGRRAREVRHRFPIDLDARTGVAEVIRTGRSALYPDVSEDTLHSLARGDAHLQAMRALRMTSLIVVPISARERVFGAITLIATESGRHYTADDLALAEELARRAGAAIDNARLYREAERSRAEAISANRAKSDFLATMSHEIRTPINAVIGYTQLMQMGLSGPLTPSQRTQIERISASTNHLLGLVNEVLDLAKVESGTLNVERERAIIGETVDDALALVRPQAASRSVSLSETCEGERASEYVGDAHRVRQVLTNLVANAVKFTPSGGSVVVSCECVDTPPERPSLRQETPYVAIRVRDTGPGIAPDQLDRIFEPFTQAETGYTRASSGTGLGLTISRRLARLMGGEITVQSALHKGSTFTLWLPRPGMRDVASASVPEIKPPSRPRSQASFEPIAVRFVQRIPDILLQWRTQMRSPHGIAEAVPLDDEQIDDHTATFLMEIATTIRVLGTDRAGDHGWLIRDSMVIIRAVADKHGAQRSSLGWSEASIERETQMLSDIAAGVLSSDQKSSPPDVAEAVTVTRELMAQASRVSRASLRLATSERLA